MTTEGNVLISAYRKAGKTSLILNLVAALTTPDKFLGGLSCRPVPGPVVYVNLELHQSMLRQYCTDMGLKIDNDMVLVQDYRGHATKFLLQEEDWRAEYAEKLWKQEASVLIIDPISPLLAMNGVDSNDNDMARVVLENLGEIAADAQLDHLIVIDHTGHAEKGRARGASGKEDWADMLWNVVADAEPNSPYRSLNVIGRGVQGHQRYMKQHNDLVLANSSAPTPMGTGRPVAGSQPAPVEKPLNKILAFLRRCDEPVTYKEIERATGLYKPDVSKAMTQAEALGRVKRRGKAGGKGGADLWVIDDQF